MYSKNKRGPTIEPCCIPRLLNLVQQLNVKCSHFTVNLNTLFCIQHNMEVAHILDHYVVGRMVIVSTALELVAFAWIYGELSV